MTTFNLADIFESVADVLGERTAIVCGDERRTFAELDERTNRLGHALAEAGIEPGDHVGIYLQNSVEFVESAMALFKIRAVPVNVNYRYVEDELRYLFNDADLAGVIFHREFAERIAAVEGDCVKLQLKVVVGDDSALDAGAAIEYEALLAKGSPEREFPARSEDDIHIIYTGGTTGMPKGVMWRHKDIFYGLLQGGNPMVGVVETAGEVAEQAKDAYPIVSMAAAPLIHGAAQASTLIGLHSGWTSVLQPRFNADEIPELIERETIGMLSLVGDAMGAPIATALEANAALGESARDISSVFTLTSAGAIFSEPCKRRFKALLPNAIMIDAYGSTETGNPGRGADPEQSSFGDGLVFDMAPNTVVLSDDLKPVEPGSGERGVVARCGHIPLGYYGDPEKTAKTFVEIAGERYVLSGDIASVEADGRVQLFGRESVCINTGGEKVFVEEVENTLKAHDAVYDAVVVGVADPTWGKRVVALVSLDAGASVADAELVEFARGHIAGYKVPKQIFFVDEVFRGPNGKADYKLSTQTAEELIAGV